MSDPYKVDRWICACCGHDSAMEPHWKVRAEHAEARVRELEAQLAVEAQHWAEEAGKAQRAEDRVRELDEHVVFLKSQHFVECAEMEATIAELRKLCGEAAEAMELDPPLCIGERWNTTEEFIAALRAAEKGETTT